MTKAVPIPPNKNSKNFEYLYLVTVNSSITITLLLTYINDPEANDKNKALIRSFELYRTKANIIPNGVNNANNNTNLMET